MVTVDNSGVYVCYLKGLVSICFRGPSKTVDFSGTCLYLCVYKQAERRLRTTYLLARWEHERTTALWSRAQGGGPSVIPIARIHYKLGHL